MNSLDRIVDGVTGTVTIPDSVTRLLDNVAGEIRLAAGNEQASEALAAMLNSQAGSLGLHVMAHTPMILATPPVHPAPAHGAAEATGKQPGPALPGETDWARNGMTEAEWDALSEDARTWRREHPHT